MNRYELLIEACAARDHLVVILLGIALGVLFARYIITRNPAGLSTKWQGIIESLWDAYILIGFVCMLAFGLIGGQR